MIRNPEILKNIFICNKILSDYLITHGVPEISMDDKGNHYFVKTERLKKALKDAPLWRKLINKIL